MAQEQQQRPDPPATTATVMTQMAQILDRLTSQPSQPGLSPEQLAAIVTTAAKAAAESGADSMRKVLHPQNAQHPGISAFSYPEGTVARPKPALTRDVYFCGHREDPDQLPPSTIELFNRFDRPMTARDGAWVADLKANGKELHITVPAKSIDDRMNLPALDLILLELLNGRASVDPMALTDRVAELEAKLASLSAA